MKSVIELRSEIAAITEIVSDNDYTSAYNALNNFVCGLNAGIFHNVTDFHFVQANRALNAVCAKDFGAALDWLNVMFDYETVSQNIRRFEHPVRVGR